MIDHRHDASRRPPIRIGCAGWSIGTAHAELVGEGESMLARYATRFDAVEINSCFYRPHQLKTYERWAASVPDDFRFSVKLPRSITHDARLVGGGDRLPPRHRSWFDASVAALWARYDIARVAADPARVPDAARVAGQGAWHYWRWHGSPRIYFSAYNDAELRTLAQELVTHAEPDREAWCILDNTAAGHAVTDAAKLQALCGIEPRGQFVPQRAAAPVQQALGF
jgi:uncharacterized protein YecE (DUF72 family)